MKKTHKPTSFAAIIVALLCAGCKEKGTYTLHSAEVYWFSGDTNETHLDVKFMFKMDTTSGKTWMLVNKGHDPFWREVGNEAKPE